jgi:NAD(P)-dependent dehydrogenase (short-subunit alcohol dehydrogenase family)
MGPTYGREFKKCAIGSRFAIPHMIKAGVVNLTRYIAAQYGKDHIRCNGVAPGLILTPAAKNNMPQAVLDIALPYHGEADDIGYTVLFLASDESKFITGQTIHVEGGHYIANPSISDFNDYVTKAKSN